MKKIILSIILIITLNFKTYSADNYLVEYKLVKSHTTTTIKQHWKEHHIPKIVLPVHNDVDVYEITYKAKWIDSTWHKASGICYIPKNAQKPSPLMMYGHGTQIEKTFTTSDNDAQQGMCLAFAADGYISLLPHYYGLGSGDGNHIYQHAWSEAMSFIYMLYAFEELNKILNVKRNGQIFLTGYSQGGHASMAAHKYLEELADPRFAVTASSPMSGAYNMTGEQEQYMFQPYPKPFYLPYLLISYQEAYNILPDQDIYTIFKTPYDTLLKSFFGEVRTKNFNELNKIIPSIPKDIVKDSIVNIFKTDSNFSFRKKLEENNLYDWKPKAPMMLCYCKGDREVHYKNSELAYNTIKANGSIIKAQNISDNLDHNTCAAFAFIKTKAYFDRFKKHGKNPNLRDVSHLKNFLMNFIKRKEEKKYKESKNDNARY
jgi:hypothetical protein